MSTRPQLEWGGISPSENLADLEREIRSLKQQLKDEREQSQQAIQDARKQSAQANRARAKLKQALSPFYQALRMIFEELDDIDAENFTIGQPSGINQPPNAAAYAAWKQQLPPSCAKIIDALLVQPATNSQLKTLCKLGSTSVSEGIRILTINNVVEKDGNLNRLRRL